MSPRTMIEKEVEMDSDNPYRAPVAELSPKDSGTPVKPKRIKLYSPGQVAGISFVIIFPLVPCWLLASNYRSLGSRSLARQSLFWGVLSSTIIVPLVSMVPKFQSLGSGILN